MQTTLRLPDSIDMEYVLGTQDEVLHLVQDAFAARVTVRGNVFDIEGDDVQTPVLEALLLDFARLAKEGESVGIEQARRMIEAVSSGSQSGVPEVLLTYRGRLIRPKTDGQEAYVRAIRDNTITFGMGPAGTGKTYLAMAMAVSALKRREVGRIVLTRPVVEAGENLGFLPGTLSEKIDPYVRPLFDALFDMMDAEKVHRLVETGAIEVAPLAFMRGRTLSDSFIVLDEAQNTTPGQMKMFLTRLGFGSKMVVTGDTTQCDLPRGVSGLKRVESILSGVDDIAFCAFSEKDVVRHSLVAAIVAAYDMAERKA